MLRLRLQTRVLLSVVVIVPNVVGAGIVFVVAGFVLPTGGVPHHSGQLLLNLVVLTGYLVLAVLIGFTAGLRYTRTTSIFSARVVVERAAESLWLWRLRKVTGITLTRL